MLWFSMIPTKDALVTIRILASRRAYSRMISGVASRLQLSTMTYSQSAVGLPEDAFDAGTQVGGPVEDRCQNANERHGHSPSMSALLYLPLPVKATRRGVRKGLLDFYSRLVKNISDA